MGTEAKKLDKNKQDSSPKQEKASPRRRSNAFKNFQFFSNSSGSATGNRDDLEAWKGVGGNDVNEISNRCTARVQSAQHVAGRLDRKLEKVEAAGEKFRKKFMKARQQLEEQENQENLRAMSLWSRKNVKKVDNLDEKIKNKGLPKSQNITPETEVRHKLGNEINKQDTDKHSLEYKANRTVLSNSQVDNKTISAVVTSDAIQDNSAENSENQPEPELKQEVNVKEEIKEEIEKKEIEKEETEKEETEKEETENKEENDDERGI